MASGKFSYFRHSVNARNDDKIKEFSRLLGRNSKEAYFYFFTLLELCASESSEGQTEFKIHNNTLRTLWETNAKGVLTVREVLAKSALVMCEPCANHVIFKIPNLPTYLGLYETKKRKEKERKEKENKILIEPKKPSPLSFLFSKNPEIQKWLNEGIHETHMMLLNKYSHHELVDLIEKAHAWALPRNKRAESWLYTFTSNKNTAGYGLNSPKKTKITPTPNNPTGNPYIEELRLKFGEEA